MDATRFDLLARRLRDHANRRTSLQLLTAGGLALLFSPFESGAAKDCGRNKKRCGNKCCSQHETCKHGKCLKKCERKEQRCGERCIKKCRKNSNSDCCFGKFPTCCPKGTFTNDFCCSKNKPVCCPPSPAVPQFPEGYCCPSGSVCADTGDGCDELMRIGAQAPAGRVAPGRGGRGAR